MTETLERPREHEVVRPPASEAATPGRRHLPAAVLLGLGAAAVGMAILAVRIVGDVRGKPLFEDEAVAGLVAARPFGEVLYTSWWERGGAPLHFVFSHLALAFDTSPYALRWLSVAFALVTIPLAWDLGRRLGGHVAGGATALVVAASSLLWVYGSFGRMYALYVFASVLAVDLFVRALREWTPRAATVAAVAAWLVPAIHPYGMFLVAVEAAIGLWLWRGRPFKAALPVGAVGLALVPLLVADLRLAERFSVGLDGEGSVAPPGDAWTQVARALQATVGGTGWTLAVAAALAALGFVVLIRRREHAVVALVVGAAVLPPLVLFLARTSSAPGLTPRHLAFLVPLVAMLVGVGVARAVRGLGVPAAGVALAALTALVLVAPLSGIRDPRDWSNDVLGGGAAATALGSPAELAAPKAWLETNVDPDAVVYPYSAVYLAALPATGEADALPYAQRETLLRALDRIEPPVPEVFVSVPLGSSLLDRTRLGQLLGPRFEFVRFDRWLLIRAEGPLVDDRDVLWAVFKALRSSRSATDGPRSAELGWYYTTTLWVVCGSLRSLGETCPPIEGVTSNQ